MIEIFCRPHFVPVLLTTPYHPKRIVSFFSLILCWRIFSNLLPADEWQVNYSFCACFSKDRSDLHLFPTILCSFSNSSRTHNPEILSLKANGNNGWWQLISKQVKCFHFLLKTFFSSLNFFKGKRNSMKTVYGSLFTHVINNWTKMSIAVRVRSFLKTFQHKKTNV